MAKKKAKKKRKTSKRAKAGGVAESKALIVLQTKRDLFVSGYVATHNATQSAIDAGFSARSARTEGWRLLKDADIRAQIQEKTQEIIEANEINAGRIMRELASVGFSRIDDYDFDPDGMVKVKEGRPAHVIGAVSSVKIKPTEVEFKLWPKTRALEMMGKQIGMFPDKVEHSGPDGGPMQMIQVNGKDVNF